VAEIKAVIFDYYETLAQLTPELRERLFGELARRAGVRRAARDAYRDWREGTTPDHVLRFDGAMRPPLDGPTPPFRTFRDVWRARSADLFRRWGVRLSPEVGATAYIRAHQRAPLYPEVRDVLAELRGRVRLGVLSDADREFLEANLRRHRLRFDAVVTSEEVGAYKPHVSLFRAVCSRLGVSPKDAVYVGDSPWADIEGARHAGLRAVWLNRHGIAWPEDIAPPPAVIRSLDELPALLEAET
jgi:2-haloalkanoic acid dehalogenase type II